MKRGEKRREREKGRAEKKRRRSRPLNGGLIAWSKSPQTSISLQSPIRTVNKLTVLDVRVILSHCLKVESLKRCFTMLIKPSSRTQRNRTASSLKCKHMAKKVLRGRNLIDLLPL